MEEVLNFFGENYIWFIVGGIVLLMTIIGYIAEKTHFGKKPSQTKKVERKGQKVKKEADSATILEEQMENIQTSKEALEELNVVDDQEEVKQEFDDVVHEEQTLEEEPMEDLDAIEIKEPIVREDDSFESAKELVGKIKEEIPEDLYAGLDGTPNAYKENDAVEELDLELPNIDSLKDEIEEENADDEIWRF